MIVLDWIQWFSYIEKYNHIISHEMLRGGDGVGLNISDTMRVSMTALFHTNDRSDLSKEWANISGTMRLHELEIEVIYITLGEILDKSCLLIN